MKTKVKTSPFWKLIVNFAVMVLCYTGTTLAAPVDGKLRVWTRIDGKEVSAKLVDLDKDKGLLELEIKGKRYKYKVHQFSEKDRSYLKTVESKELKGSIKHFSVDFPNDEQKKFFNQHFLNSFVWKGESKGQLPFIFYTPPKEKTRKKVPLIIHLCGTGGIGQGNLKPLFNDAGGSAKNFLSKKLQGTSPCYVMIPQPSRRGAWFSASFEDPSDHLEWIVNTLDHLVADARYNIDANRVYVTGLSMGGAGVYQALAKYPDVFAAGIPISYVENVTLFNKKNSRSLWIVVNKGDRGISLDMLEQFKKQYKKFNKNLKVTVNNKGGHNAWSDLLSDKKFKTWLFRCQLEE